MPEQRELLYVKESLSPRRHWMREHGIGLVYEDPGFNHPGNCVAVWHGDLFAAIGTDNIAYGKTVDEALHALAAALKLPLWYALPARRDQAVLFAAESNLSVQDRASLTLGRNPLQPSPVISI
jgi:hypothetical protein